jgi:hypothetical protein
VEAKVFRHYHANAALPADLRKALPPKEASNVYYRDLREEIRHSGRTCTDSRSKRRIQ